MKYGNLNRDYIESTYQLEGYFDKYNLESQDDQTKLSIIEHRRNFASRVGKLYEYEFIFTPNDPFLNENHPLPPGVELKLSFDRLPARYSCLEIVESDILSGKTLELKDLYAQVEYVSSPLMRNAFDSIQIRPLEYNYDECTVICRSIPINEKYVRLENIRGGNCPDYLFFGLVKTSAFSGSFDYQSHNYENFDLKEVNLTLNGNSCHNYPMRIKNNRPVWAYYRLFDTLGRLINPKIGRQWEMTDFAYNCLFSHKFEGEDTSNGWIGVDLAFDITPSTQLTLGNLKIVKNRIIINNLVMWAIHNVKATIDKFHLIGKFDL